MKKKIKDLTLEDCGKICRKHSKDCLSDKCPLRIDGLCFGIIFLEIRYKKLIENLEREVEIE